MLVSQHACLTRITCVSSLELFHFVPHTLNNPSNDRIQNVNKLPTKWFEFALIFHSLFFLSILFSSFRLVFLNVLTNSQYNNAFVVIQFNRLWGGGAFEGRTRRLNQLLLNKKKKKKKQQIQNTTGIKYLFRAQTTRFQVNSDGGGKRNFPNFL